MAGRGKTPKSDEVRAATGSRTRRRGGGARVPAGKPTCPPFLGKAAKQMWRDAVKWLDEAGLLTRADRAILAVFCVAWEMLQTATEALARDGLTTASESGTRKGHPAISVQVQAMTQLRAAASALALSPEGRLRLGVTVAPAADEPPQAKYRIRG